MSWLLGTTSPIIGAVVQAVQPSQTQISQSKPTYPLGPIKGPFPSKHDIAEDILKLEIEDLNLFISSTIGI